MQRQKATIVHASTMVAFLRTPKKLIFETPVNRLAYKNLSSPIFVDTVKSGTGAVLRHQLIVGNTPFNLFYGCCLFDGWKVTIYFAVFRQFFWWVLSSFTA